MSLSNLLENGKGSLDDSELPDPESEDTEERAAEMRAANAAVSEIIIQAKEKKKRGPYVIYDPEIRARIGKHASEHGITSACKKFSFELGKKLNESTVRTFREAYQRQLAACEDGDKVTNLPVGNRGRPPLLGSELDQRIQDYIRRLQTNGVAINRRIVLGAARGMVEQHDPSVMRENGGSIDLTEKWAQSFMGRMSITPRKSRKRKQEGTTPKNNFQNNNWSSGNAKTHEDAQLLDIDTNTPTNSSSINSRTPNRPTTTRGSAAKVRKEDESTNIEIIKESLQNIVKSQLQAVEVDRQRLEIERRRAENEHQFFQGMISMMSQVVAQMCQQQSTPNMF
ncbi:uncharacterized protein LOC117103185 [Anneissia japonica]|uniref:uncharacterized protein LOC117103185 n=1 Tax=Anneissia japonica TaxID=1529436 RepID=UPI0014257265|nr:uncharacterized protein LOC117103185 [Anneissia japonica]